MVRIHGHRDIKSSVRALHQHGSQPQQHQRTHFGGLKRKGKTASHITHCNRPSPPTHSRRAVSVFLKQANREHTSPMPYADDALIHSRFLTRPPPLPSNFEPRRPFRLPAKLPFSNYASRTPPLSEPLKYFCKHILPHVAKQARLNIHCFKYECMTCLLAV